MSRKIELDSASLHDWELTSLPEMVKSATADEETPESNRRSPRGDWRRRAGKEKSRNLRDPYGAARPVRESDDLIVAGKGLINLEQRRSTVGVQLSKQDAAA